MDENANTQEAYRSNFPEKPQMKYFSMSTADTFFLVVMLMFFLLAKDHGGRVTSMGVVVFTATCLYRNDNDRLYRLAFQTVQNMWIRFVWKGILWESNTSKPKKFRWMRPPPLAIPLKVRYISADGTEIGIIQNLKKRTFSIVIVGDGSPIAALDLRDQFAAHSQFAEVIKRGAATIKGHAFGMSFLFSRGPVNVPALARVYAQNLTKAVLFPETVDVPFELMDIPREEWAGLSPERLGLPIEEWPADVARSVRVSGIHKVVVGELLNTTDTHGGDVVMSCVCTIREEGRLKAAVKGRGKGLKKTEVGRLPLLQLAQTVADGLKNCGVVSPRVLDKEGIHRYLRASWDIAQSGGYHKMLSSGAAGQNELHWPQEKVKVTNNSLLTDGTYHAVIRITGNPGFVSPNFFRQVFGIDVPWLAIALVNETASSRADYEILDRMITVSGAFSEGSGAIHKGPRARQRDQARVNHQERIFRDSFRSDFSILVGIGATDPDELEDKVDEVIRSLYGAGIRASRVKGPCRQLTAALTAKTGVSML